MDIKEKYNELKEDALDEAKAIDETIEKVKLNRQR